MEIIRVENLIREFKTRDKSNNSLFKGRYIVKRVVDDVSFSIQEGDIVGYLGPNGAGKSTTIKMLSGVLVPSSGNVKVMGLVPHQFRTAHAKNIGVVFGHRTQLWWDLPLIESLKLIGAIYDVPKKKLKENIDYFSETLDMSDFLYKPVRELSLGQRMRGDISASLLHNPKVLFLDEPTIGLDLIAKEKIQDFLKKINEEQKITIILTTHNMDDIEKLCKRVIFIDKGKVIFNGYKEEMESQFESYRYLVLEVNDFHVAYWTGKEIFKTEGNRLWFKIEEDRQIANIVDQISKMCIVKNISIIEPSIEDVIRQLYPSRENESINAKVEIRV